MSPPPTTAVLMLREEVSELRRKFERLEEAVRTMEDRLLARIGGMQTGLSDTLREQVAGVAAEVQQLRLAALSGSATPPRGSLQARNSSGNGNGGGSSLRKLMRGSNTLMNVGGGGGNLGGFSGCPSASLVDSFALSESRGSATISAMPLMDSVFNDQLRGSACSFEAPLLPVTDTSSDSSNNSSSSSNDSRSSGSSECGEIANQPTDYQQQLSQTVVKDSTSVNGAAAPAAAGATAVVVPTGSAESPATPRVVTAQPDAFDRDVSTKAHSDDGDGGADALVAEKVRMHGVGLTDLAQQARQHDELDDASAASAALKVGSKGSNSGGGGGGFWEGKELMGKSSVHSSSQGYKTGSRFLLTEEEEEDEDLDDDDSKPRNGSKNVSGSG